MKAFDKVLQPALTIDGKQLNNDLIVKRTKAIAGMIEEHYGPNTDCDESVPMCVGVQFGALFIHPLLLQSLSVEFMMYVGTIRAKSYLENGQQSPVKITNPSFDATVKGRSILIVDDLVESGQSMYQLKKWFEAEGAKDVRTFALLSKPEKRTYDIEVDWIGFQLRSDEWYVGMGLDSNNKCRHFSNVVVLRDPKPKDRKRETRRPK